MLGDGLSIEEDVMLRSDIARIKSADRLTVATFWGRIYGTKCDYLIVAGLPMHSSSPRRSFYYTFVRRAQCSC